MVQWEIPYLGNWCVRITAVKMLVWDQCWPHNLFRGTHLVRTSVPVLESSVMSGPEKIRSRGQWSHIVS